MYHSFIVYVICVVREKKLLVGSDDYGRDLTGVQNLRKKHKRLEAEIENHEPSIQVCICFCGKFLLITRTCLCVCSFNSELELF